jgi:hypothetical protein
MRTFDTRAAVGQFVEATQGMVDCVMRGAIGGAPKQMWSRKGGCPTLAEAHDIWARILGCWGEKIIQTVKIPSDEDTIQEQVFHLLNCLFAL